MKQEMRDSYIRQGIYLLRGYVAFFVTISAFTTASILLFLRSIHLTDAQVRAAAPISFFNIMLLSLLATVLDAVRRKVSIERPLKKLLDALIRMAEGDYEIALAPAHPYYLYDQFDWMALYLGRLAGELKSVETLRTDFIANVSHELKTPLAVMQNYATLLQAPGLPEEKRQEYARAITDSTRRLSALITNILKLNKLENQQIFPTHAPYDLGEQLCACLLDFEDVWERRGIELDTDLAPDIIVDNDAELLALVWNNLLSNAMKFTPDGGQVRVTLRRENGCAVVAVSDTGCGISPEQGKHIFDKFYQSDPSRATQGNGLGLALVKRVIDIVGGTISVESELGRGSRFTVTLKEAPHGTDQALPA